LLLTLTKSCGVRLRLGNQERSLLLEKTSWWSQARI
jgi:hypothetical protein